MTNRELLINVCQEIKPLLDQLVLVGGCATELLITDRAASSPRTTQDVDMTVNTLTLNDYYKIESELCDLGFSQTIDEHGVICRWCKDNLILDVMPADKKILGFTNRWYSQAIEYSEAIDLNGLAINHIIAAIFIATKLEAFDSRGNNDFMMSHDLEDIISVVDGRSTIVEDVAASPQDIQIYVKSRINELLNRNEFNEALPGFLPPDPASQLRLELLEKKLQKIAGH